jgi:outer membrane protein assembly factor BamB
VLWGIKDFGLSYGVTPTISGDILIGADSAYKITPEKAELLWKNKGLDAASSPVVYKDCIYVFHSWYDGADWRCFDLKTGEQKWKQPAKADCNCSSPVLADGKIILPFGFAHNGTPYELEMLQATPEKYVQLGLFNAGVSPMSSPAMVGGRLYLRLTDGVACYDLTEAGNK